MAIRGITKNIATTPLLQKNIDPKENYIPTSIELRNGRLTDAMHWEKRQGFGAWKSTGANSAVDLLIPEDTGYAITDDERVFTLGDTPAEITYSFFRGSKTDRTQYVNRNSKYILCDGGIPLKISNGAVTLLGGTPPNARFIDILGNKVLMAGQTDTSLSTNPLQEVRASAPNNEEDYSSTLSLSFYIKMDGSKIRNLKVLKEKAYVFKDFGIEVWVEVGSDAATYVTQQSAWVDKGTGADYSVVKANNTLYWYGDDRRFYMLEGGVAKVISDKIERYVFELLHPESIYGINFEQEHVIRWFAPDDGKCFIEDYKHKIMYEDNTWGNAQWERMPINSYMFLNGKTYVGDYSPTGEVFEWGIDFKTDNGKPIRNVRKFNVRPSASGRNTRLNRIGFTFDRGDKAYSTGSVPVFMWRYKTDNGLWTDYKEVSLGQFDSTGHYIDYPGTLGVDWGFEIVQTDSNDFTLINMDATFEEMRR